MSDEPEPAPRADRAVRSPPRRPIVRWSTAARAARARSRPVPSTIACEIASLRRSSSTSVRRPRPPSSSAGPRGGRPRPTRRTPAPVRRELSLLVRASIGGRGLERPITAARAIERHDVRQGREQVRGDVRLALERDRERAREAEEQRSRRRQPSGLHLPKITAASAMKPRPLVMFSLNAPPKPNERYAPPSAASMPETITAP